MGLFNWWKKKKEEEFQLDPNDKPRLHHYVFAHRILPQMLAEGDSVLGILAIPENQEFLTRQWKALGEQMEPREQLSPTGMQYASHWLGGEHLVILIEFPPAYRCTEAPLAAITTSPQIRYITLETAERALPSEMLVLGEWVDGSHRNHGHDQYGVRREVMIPAFLKAVCRMLQIPETIEQPAIQQLSGMSLNHPVFNMTMPEKLSSADASQVEAWDQQAETALEADKLTEAEHLYRQILDLRMARQGPENTHATLAHADVVKVLQLQNRHREAEQLCRSWWKICRRFRMLGHAETMFAIRSLIESLAGQGNFDSALQLANYSVQLAGLARGIKSSEASLAHSYRDGLLQMINAGRESASS